MSDKLDFEHSFKRAIAAKDAEIERLRAWKESAMLVLGEWDGTFAACGSPGKLGESKAKAVRAEIARLQQQNADLVEALRNLLDWPALCCCADSRVEAAREALRMAGVIPQVTERKTP